MRVLRFIRTNSSKTVRRVAALMPLSMAALALLASTAQAHSLSAQATCGSVTFNWDRFSNQGAANNGLNTPTWSVAFTPVGGQTTNLSGSASFPGSAYSLTVPLPVGNG